MVEKNNMVAHFQEGTSDKVYIASVRLSMDGRWSVVGKFGRRGKTFQSQVKLHGVSESFARKKQHELFESKLAKGYVNIESSLYPGTVTRKEVLEYLESELQPGKLGDEVKADVWDSIVEGKKKSVKPVSMVAVCLDNRGLEEGFDAGIEYMFEAHKDEKMLWVYNKFGEKVECFGERFKLVKEV